MFLRDDRKHLLTFTGPFRGCAAGGAWRTVVLRLLGDEMPNGARVLLVEDDLKLRALLERYLSDNGLMVTGVTDGVRMDAAIGRQDFDLMILDLMLPGEDGLAICRRLRGQGNDLPILMLTAKGDDIDRIVGLEIGADDYLGKPCNPRELLARIKAILRRRPAPLAGAPQEQPVRLRFGPWTLDTGRRMLSREGCEATLTSGEFAVLRVLASHPGETLTRERLMSLARGREHGAYDRSIDVQISRLRRMIEADPAKPRYIQTVWGVGYVFVADTAV